MADITSPYTNNIAGQLDAGAEKPADDLGMAPPQDPLAVELMKYWGEAYAAKREYQAEMEEAYWAARNQYSPDVECKLQGNEKKFYIGLFSRQLSTYMAWVLDRISQTTRFFTLSPTPQPEIPERFKLKAVNKVLKELEQLSFLPQEEALRYAQERLLDLKSEINRIRYETAKRQLGGMETLMDDILDEGDFRRAYMAFHQDMFMSIGVMRFPAIEVEDRLRWSGDNVQVKQVTTMKFKRVSPMDFFWAPDSTTAQDGRYVIERMRVSTKTMQWLATNSEHSAATQKIAQYLVDAHPTGTDWLNTASTSGSEATMATHVGKIGGHVLGTHDVLAFHFRLKGDRLQQYGVTEYGPKKKKISPDEEYAVEAWVAYNLTCYLVVNPHPLGERPYYTAAYEPVPGQLYGTSAWKKIRAYEVAFRNGHRNLIRSVSFESGPIAEVDSGRFSATTNPMPNKLTPWMQYTTDSDYSGGGRPAVNFLATKANSTNLRVYLDSIELQAQHATGIYNTMAGATAYGTVGRTRFGVESVQSNATKIVFAKAEFVDKYAIEPALKALYSYLMVYHDDAAVKADAQVSVRGLTSLSNRDAEVQRAIQLLQYLPAMLQVDNVTQANSVPKSVVQQLFRTIIASLGGNIDDLPDPFAAQTVAQAIGLEPSGDFQETRDDLQAELPQSQIRIRPQVDGAPAV